MAMSHLKLVTPAIVKRTVTPRRHPNADLRTREHLTEAEVERLMAAARRNRWGHRDATMVMIAFRHGLRASELIDLRWDQVDLEHALLHVRRLKSGLTYSAKAGLLKPGGCGGFRSLMSEPVTPSMHSRSSFQLKMDINWKACARTSNSLLSFHAPPMRFMCLYVVEADAWDAFLSVSFIFAIVPIDA